MLIEIAVTSAPCGLKVRQKDSNKQESTSPRLVGKTKILDAVVDGKLPNDLNSASIFSKVIDHKLSNSSSGDLYMRYRMNFTDDPVQNHTPQFMDLGFSSINVLDESSGVSTPATIIRRPTYDAHYIAHHHVSGEVTAVGMS